jgi:hypothetical protein
VISFDADIIAWVKGYKKGTWQIDVEGGGDLGFTDLFARSDSGAASSPAAAGWSAPTMEDSAVAESGARGVARLVTTKAMNACQRPCFAFWRIACLVLSIWDRVSGLKIPRAYESLILAENVHRGPAPSSCRRRWLVREALSERDRRSL